MCKVPYERVSSITTINFVTIHQNAYAHHQNAQHNPLCYVGFQGRRQLLICVRVVRVVDGVGSIDGLGW